MLTAAAQPKPREQRLLTSEEFLEWLEPGVFADLINGEIAMHSPVSLKHARLINFIDFLLRLYIERKDIGELHRESVAVRLSIREVFMPDLAYFTKAQASRLAGTHAPFAPAFVLEALSPSTARNDLGRKFAAYERYGVQEYWILDPEKLEHHFYRREGDIFGEFGVGAERIESSSIHGFWVKRAWLNPTKLPVVSQCLAEILGTSKVSRRRKT
jgi:Uma2 family endonuclease